MDLGIFSSARSQRRANLWTVQYYARTMVLVLRSQTAFQDDRGLCWKRCTSAASSFWKGAPGLAQDLVLFWTPSAVRLRCASARIRTAMVATGPWRVGSTAILPQLSGAYGQMTCIFSTSHPAAKSTCWHSGAESASSPLTRQIARERWQRCVPSERKKSAAVILCRRLFVILLCPAGKVSGPPIASVIATARFSPGYTGENA